jgi:hypothetical protein
MVSKYFRKTINIKFHETPFNDSRVVPCGWTEEQTEGRTNMKKIIVAFCNFAKELKIIKDQTPSYFYPKIPQISRAENSI